MWQIGLIISIIFALNWKIWYNIYVARNCDEEFENFLSFEPSWRSGSAFP